MNLLIAKIATAWHLGIPNIARILHYKLGLLTGINSVRRVRAPPPQAPFFLAQTRPHNPLLIARNGWFERAEAFGVVKFSLNDTPPDWKANCLTGTRFQNSDRNWWEIPDFDSSAGDIKAVWEFSRFDWVLACAQQYVKGNALGLRRLESWLHDWCNQNPPYIGPNWKCGQEASIRVMHLVAATLLLQQTSAAAGLLALVRVHLLRIAPTLQYAVAQDNNHGTSEAAALFIGGSFMLANGDQHGRHWMNAGRRWLENRAARLFSEDGSFSQYSLNYHRLAVETYSLAEVWRRQLNLERFSEQLYQRCEAGTQWLYTMVNAENGDGPNLGANDGAKLLPLTDSGFRDYRPTVQLAAALFLDSKAYSEEGIWNQPLHWFGLKIPAKRLHKPESHVFADGGFAVLRRGGALALLRYPRFRFRPSQCDALHLDLWLGSENSLPDAGSYSYNCDSIWQNYFPGTAAHNTIQFDGDEQMPRLGRFLYGDWLLTNAIEPLKSEDDVDSFSAGYRDSKGRRHLRKMTLSASHLIVQDSISGFSKVAVLRWRLQPGKWELDTSQRRISGERLSIQITASVPIVRMEIREGWESRYYLEKSALPVLEVEVGQAGELVSEMRWSSI